MKIIVAVDASPFAAKVLEKGIEAAKCGGGELCILSVAPILDELDVMPAELNDRLKASALRIVEDARATAQAAGLTALTRVEQSVSPADSIVALAAEWGADLIVVGHKGKSNLERFLVGSVAQQVVAHAGTSVLVVK